MKQKRVAVLRGGPSEEYAVSLLTGAAVLRALDNLDYNFKDIVVTKKGEWLESGIARKPEQALEGVDVVFIALHGHYGEDGQVQRILQRLAVPFTGSGALASAVAFNKELTKDTLTAYDIKMPRHKRVSRDVFVTADFEFEDYFTELPEELFVKPLASGSSHGASFAPNRQKLKEILDTLLMQYESVLVEEFIRGREATVGVLDNFRNEAIYALPIVEIVPPNGEPLFSYENKYNGKTREICPGRFSYHEKAKLAEVAQQVHKVINCGHYSRSDFLVRDGEVYFLEVNTLPGLTNESLLPKAAAAVGLEFNQLIEHFVETATV